ncbi:MAG: RNA chaperone Hfq [Candidatus Bathyarchaeia archaeon]
MAEKGKAQPAGPAKAEEKAPPPKPDLIRDLWREKAELKLHLADGTVLTGRIKQFDTFNIQLLTEGERLYLIPKHALVYIEM